MIFHHRHSFFPLVLALLTLGLFIFMFYAFTGRATPPPGVVNEPTPVSSQEYAEDLRELTDSFIELYQQQDDNLLRLVLVEKTLDQLLGLRVPAQEKDSHLSLAVELNQMQRAFRESNGTEGEAFERFIGISATVRHGSK